MNESIKIPLFVAFQTMSSARSRSNSASRTVKPSIVTEGVDLCHPTPTSELQRKNVDEGRKAERLFLKHLTPGALNDVTHHGEYFDGPVLIDMFRVTSGASHGFGPGDERKMAARYAKLERGESNKIYFVSVPQSRYDRRVWCFDLNHSQCFIVFLIVGIIALCAFASGYTNEAIVAWAWLNGWGNIVNGTKLETAAK